MKFLFIYYYHSILYRVCEDICHSILFRIRPDPNGSGMIISDPYPDPDRQKDSDPDPYSDPQHKFYIYNIYVYMLPFQTENGKWKPWRFSLIRIPFHHRANGSFSFVRLLTKNKQRKLSVCNRAKWTCPSMEMKNVIIVLTNCS
jgi:hypothetical protein